MDKKLKIALIADPEIPVPPLLYGGIERILAMLIDEYHLLGHEVTLFAHVDSKTPAKLIPYKGKSSQSNWDTIINSFQINRELLLNKYDIVHSFGRLAYILPILPLAIPKIMSYQREPTLTQIAKAMRFAKQNTMAFTGCSAYISEQIKPTAPAFPIFNGVDLNTYDFQEQVDESIAPLIFLGRIEPIKGTHHAIQVAKATQKKLIIAGNIPAEYQNYFDQEIKPHLNDQIQYVGPVNDVQKNKLLGQSIAFLMPIDWNEPFGIVMAEAMATGTPVVGFKRGSVPEVVKHGINGYSCFNTEEMINYVNQIKQISRKDVRLDCEVRFSAKVIAQQYLDLYHQRIKAV